MRKLFLDPLDYSAVENEKSVFEFCTNSTDGQVSSIMGCVSDSVESLQRRRDEDLNRWLIVFAASLVFFMQAGFAMLCAGCVRKKNVQNTMLKNLLDACGAGLGFFFLGYGFAFGGSDTDEFTFIGTSNFLNMGDVDEAVWFFQYAFSATCVTIVAGTLAERCQMAAYLAYSVVLTAFVYPVVAHSIWSSNGFLSIFAKEPYRGIGSIDFAGSGVIHMTGGTVALIATYILGPRKGRFYDTRGRPLAVPKPFPGHSVALQLLGTMILWFGFDTGRVAATAAVNTSLSAASGAVFALVVNLIYEERKTGEFQFSITKAMNGALSGLVAITAGCGTFQNYGAIVTGVVAGGLYLLVSAALIRWRLDDAVDAIPVHMVCGAWGIIAVGLFSDPDLQLFAFGNVTDFGVVYGGDGTLLTNQILVILFVAGWSTFTMGPFFIFLNRMGWFRSDSLEELIGLDEIYHGGLHAGDEVVEEAALHSLVRDKAQLDS